MVVERSQGCNHMTCLCKYQFCYICGQRWTSNHTSKHSKRAGDVGEDTSSSIVQLVDCLCCCDCCNIGGCHQFWISKCGGAIKFMLKVVICLIECILIVLELVCVGLPYGFWILTCTVTTGIFLSPFEIICESEGVYFFLYIIGFPITILLGIRRSFRQFFWPEIS